MVVMERIDTGYDEFQTSSNFDAARASLLHRAIWKGLKALHGMGYVHGNIRHANLIVAKNGKPDFMLIGFDWAGRESTARYPMNVYTGAGLWRPADAYDGNPITTKHDEQC
jgi:serine/threonine protein kinase